MVEMQMKEKPYVTKEEIKKGLSELGLRRGDFIEVHSSLSSFGYVEGGADAVIDALLEVIGEEGTVVMPALSDFEIGKPLASFEVDRSPIRKSLGRIAEIFRQRPRAVRSFHPLYSWVAIGAKANWFIEGQEKLMIPCGGDQPMYKLYEFGEGAHILLLGVDQNSNSLVHVAEEIANVPYLKEKIEVSKLLVQDFYKLPLEEREKIMAKHRTGPRRDFTRVENLLRESGIMTIGKIGKSTVRLIKARDMVDIVSKFLKEDPYFLVVE